VFYGKSITHLEKPAGSMILNLSLFPAGPETSLNFIPDGLAGTYAWFQTYRYSDDPEALYSQLVADIERPKFSERSGVISPYYEVGIRSFGKLSAGKRERLQEALKNSDFRQHLHHAIGNSIFFQSPLYVGKASDLKIRIGQHLSPNSVLRARLDESGISIDTAMLMLCPIWNGEDPQPSIYDESVEPPISDDDETGDDLPIGERYEDLLEEIFSRIFCPQFSIKLG
jgi:hypothetical protein